VSKEIKMTTDSSYGKLVKLGDVGQTVAEKEKDIRGRRVLERDGLKLGKINVFLVGDREYKVRFLEVENGGVQGRMRIVSPYRAISSITEHEVHIDQVNDSSSGPAVVDDLFWGETYDHKRYRPYWSMGYAYPGFPHFAFAFERNSGASIHDEPLERRVVPLKVV
jgi:hypothetical protein